MTQRSIVTSPDGRRWRVRRRWLERPFPSLRRLWRKNRNEASDAWDLGWGLETAGGIGFIVLAVVAVVVVCVLLLSLALDLLLIALVVGSGLFGRVVLRRPWVIEAVDVGEPEERVAFAVTGWRDSGRALDELRGAIASTGPPQRLSLGRALATKPSG
jgi:hypothetical protein